MTLRLHPTFFGNGIYIELKSSISKKKKKESHPSQIYELTCIWSSGGVQEKRKNRQFKSLKSKL